MKKTLKVLCTILALCFMMSFASAAEMGSAEDELKATAEYVMDRMLAVSTAADGYVAGYNDVYQAIACLKAGVSNDEVIKVLDESIAAQMKEYKADEFLGCPKDWQTGETNTAYYSYNLAIAILYLQERGEDVTSYQGKNMLEMLEEAFEENGTPEYGYQLMATVVENYPYCDFAAFSKQIKEGVLEFYENDDYGVGMNYWGVTADNDGQMFPALFAYKDEDAVKTMVKDSMAYLETMESQDGAIMVADWMTGDLYPNSDSTMMALKFAATFGYKEAAEKYYKALGQFKSATTDGVYTYGGYDSDYSTVDALYALLQYVTGEDALFLSSDEVEYTIKEGADAEWVNDSDKDLVISSSANFSAYVEVLVDDKAIDAANYSVESGSTKVTLKTTYLKTLPVGKHILTIVSVDGKAETSFTIKEAEVPTPTPTPTATPTPAPNDKTPPTGDSTNVMILMVLALLSGSVVLGLRKER